MGLCCLSVATLATATDVICRCGERVLRAPLPSGLPVLVEIEEIHPLWRCPVCLSGRQLNERCWRCGTLETAGPETRWIGEDLEGVLGVAISDDGVARLFLFGTNRRRPGESVHRPHRC